MSPLAIVGLTVVVLVGYILAYIALHGLFAYLEVEMKEARGLRWLALIIPFLSLAVVLFVIELIHTIIFCWAAYDAAKGVRNWWHKGARK